MTRYRLVLSTFSCCALLVLATSCSFIPPYPDPPSRVNEAYRDVLEQRRSQYRVKPGDQITLRIFREQEPLDEQTFQVLDDGRGDPFFMTNYHFAGKTIPEIEKDMPELLRVETAAKSTEPDRVSIFVTPLGDVVYLTGEFERPATVPLRLNMTVKEAMASVLGMKVTGDTDYAMLRRPFRDPLYPEIFRIDLNDDSQDIYLLPGDEVHLGRTFLYSIVVYMREYIFGIIPSQLYSLPFGAF